MIKVTSHSLAQKLLSLPDLPVIIDGIGEPVGIACEPNIGWTSDGNLNKRDEVVVIEIVTKKQEDKDRENEQLRMDLLFFARKIKSSLKNCKKL